MPLPHRWSLEETLELSLYKNAHPAAVKEAIEKYNNLDDFMNSPLPPALVNAFRQDELFSDKESIKERAEKQLETLNNPDYSVITFWDDEYPALLKQIDLAPPVLYIWGELQPPDSLSFGIVGTRKCTRYGRRQAEKFAAAFAEKGIIVTSGLAVGIDTQAHRACLDSGGITYAVVPSGIDKIDTFKHDLAERIVNKGGAIISEYPFGTPAALGYFLRRNRIISGISKAVVVVESAVRGGSLNTAQWAFNQSRDLYAVPGNIDSDMSEGTNLLIKNNKAAIALTPEQVIKDTLNYSAPESEIIEAQKEIVFDSDEDKKIYEALSNDPLHIDELAGITSFDMPTLLVKLLNLEFSGLIKQLPGKNFIRN